ncbi:hypothetical protein LSAT2_019429 [Lamellibrachia satsuma]|nr:hypothetical protein LSAT2_019429 [Lamellibrachia satsuma]
MRTVSTRFILIAAYCKAGQQLVQDSCAPCPQGFYKSDKNDADKFGNCTVCPVDLITDSIGATNIDNCTRGNCSAGYKTVKHKCIPCPMGTYQPQRWNDTCMDCPGGSITSGTGATSEDECKVSVVKYAFSLTLDLTWTDDFSSKSHPAYKGLQAKIVNSIEYSFSRDLTDIYMKGLLKIKAMTQGSVVVLLEALFDNKTDVKERVKYVLTKAVESGVIPVPPGDDFAPLKTVSTALPQVVKVDPNIDCRRGQERTDDGGCDDCPKGSYQPSEVTDFCYKCGAAYSTVHTGSVGDKVDVCKDVCSVDPTYCQHGGSCTFDRYGKKATCTCRDYYKGDRCQTRTDAYAESSVHLIIGLVIGGTALVLFLMLIAAFFSYRRRMRERKEKQKEEHARARLSHPSMTRALPAAATFGGYAPRTALGTTAPWSQPGQCMFYNDDVDDKPTSPTQYPNYQGNAVFQRS